MMTTSPKIARFLQQPNLKDLLPQGRYTRHTMFMFFFARKNGGFFSAILVYPRVTNPPPSPFSFRTLPIILLMPKGTIFCAGFGPIAPALEGNLFGARRILGRETHHLS